MNENEIRKIPLVWVLDGDPALTTQVQEIAQIVAVPLEVSRGDVPGHGHLLIVTGEAPPGPAATLPQVSVGRDGDLDLPRDAELLAQLLRQATTLPRPSGSQLTPLVVVAGWHGGAGTSTVAHQLARVGGALLLDASGAQYPLNSNPTLDWSSVAADDPPGATELRAGLPRYLGVRTLRSAGVDAPRPGDARVGAVVKNCQVTQVVDAGIWSEGCMELRKLLQGQGRLITMVLVGHDPTKSERLEAIIQHHDSTIDFILTRGRPPLEVSLLGEQKGIPSLIIPRRKWSSLWRRLANG